METQWTTNFDQQVRRFGHSPIVLLDHTGERPLVLCSEGSLAVLVFTAFFPTGSDATDGMVFVEKYPPWLVAFIAGLLMDP